MDSLAIIQGQKIVKATIGFSFKKKTIETKDRLAIIQGQKIVESTVAFSRNRFSGNY